eukprot:symbB.v1.2.001180.t2/scaffold60.1/size581591/20
MWSTPVTVTSPLATLSASLCLNSTLASLQLENWEAAERFASRALRSYESSKGYFRRGLARAQMKGLEADAKRDFEMALKLEPKGSPAAALVQTELAKLTQSEATGYEVPPTAARGPWGMGGWVVQDSSCFQYDRVGCSPGSLNLATLSMASPQAESSAKRRRLTHRDMHVTAWTEGSSSEKKKSECEDVEINRVKIKKEKVAEPIHVVGKDVQWLKAKKEIKDDMEQDMKSSNFDDVNDVPLKEVQVAAWTETSSSEKNGDDRAKIKMETVAEHEASFASPLADADGHEDGRTNGHFSTLKTEDPKPKKRLRVRPCCPANFFLRSAREMPTAPPEDAPACVQRLNARALRCLQRFHEKHSQHTPSSEEGASAPMLQVERKSSPSAAEFAFEGQDTRGLQDYKVRGMDCMKMWPWMRDLPISVWAGRGWAFDENGLRRLTSTGGSGAMQGVEVFESVGAAAEEMKPKDAILREAAGAASHAALPLACAEGPKPTSFKRNNLVKQSGVQNVRWHPTCQAWTVDFHTYNQQGRKTGRTGRKFSVKKFMVNGRSEAEADAAALEAAKAFHAELVRKGILEEPKERDPNFTSDVPGVQWTKRRKKWEVNISLKKINPKEPRKTIWGGYFTEKAAAEAEAWRLQELHGLEREVKAVSTLSALPVFEPKVPYAGVKWEQRSQQWRAQCKVGDVNRDFTVKPKDHSEAERERSFQVADPRAAKRFQIANANKQQQGLREVTFSEWQAMEQKVAAANASASAWRKRLEEASTCPRPEQGAADVTFSKLLDALVTKAAKQRPSAGELVPVAPSTALVEMKSEDVHSLRGEPGSLQFLVPGPLAGPGSQRDRTASLEMAFSHLLHELTQELERQSAELQQLRRAGSKEEVHDGVGSTLLPVPEWKVPVLPHQPIPTLTSQQDEVTLKSLVDSSWSLTLSRNNNSRPASEGKEPQQEVTKDSKDSKDSPSASTVISSWMHAPQAQLQEINILKLSAATKGTEEFSGLDETEEAGFTVMRAQKTKKFISQKPWYVINPDTSLWGSIWQGVVAAALLFVAFVTPVQVGLFELQLDTVMILSFFVDFVFLTDMILQFFTTYSRDTSDGIVWEVDLRRIAWHYMKTWFFLDLITVFPFDVITLAADGGMDEFKSIKVLRALRLLKLMRLVKTSRIIHNLEIPLSIPYQKVALARFLIVLILVCHWVACLWAMTLNLGSDYPSNWFDNVEDHQDRDPARIYIAAFYFACYTITSVGFGDITPQNVMERYICSGILLASGLAWAYILGEVGAIVSDMTSESQEFRRRMHHLNVMMQEQGLRWDLRRRLRSFFLQNRHHWVAGFLHWRHIFFAQASTSASATEVQETGFFQTLWQGAAAAIGVVSDIVTAINAESDSEDEKHTAGVFAMASGGDGYDSAAMSLEPSDWGSSAQYCGGAF